MKKQQDELEKKTAELNSKLNEFSDLKKTVESLVRQNETSQEERMSFDTEDLREGGVPQPLSDALEKPIMYVTGKRYVSYSFLENKKGQITYNPCMKREGITFIGSPVNKEQTKFRSTYLCKSKKEKEWIENSMPFFLKEIVVAGDSIGSASEKTDTRFAIDCYNSLINLMPEILEQRAKSLGVNTINTNSKDEIVRLCVDKMAEQEVNRQKDLISQFRNVSDNYKK